MTYPTTPANPYANAWTADLVALVRTARFEGQLARERRSNGIVGPIAGADASVLAELAAREVDWA